MDYQDLTSNQGDEGDDASRRQRFDEPEHLLCAQSLVSIMLHPSPGPAEGCHLAGSAKIASAADTTRNSATLDHGKGKANLLQSPYTVAASIDRTISKLLPPSDAVELFETPLSGPKTRFRSFRCVC